MQTAIERWHELLRARAQQMDAAYARLGRTSADYWDRRARGFHQATKDTTATDPLFLRVKQELTPAMRVLDVGAGTGRFALAFAPLAGQVIAVEPNTSMLNFLHNDADGRGMTNIEYVLSTWQDAPANLEAEIVICSHVLYAVQDIEAFLAKLVAATRKTCYIYMRATHLDELTAPIWQHFHGEKRCMPPAYIHALDILFEMGIYANVEMVVMPPSLRFSSVDGAVEELIEQLILPNNAQTRQELHGMLANWLVEREGMFVPPVDALHTAILQITP